MASEAWEFLSHGEADTERLGAALAGALEPGAVVALIGDLGAGKTRLVQATATALGIDRRAVNSPTFVLINEYEGRLPVAHFDTYRLRDIDDFLELGAEELMESSGVCFIEWADRVRDALPRDYVRIEIAPEGPEIRRFRLAATGPRSACILERWRTELGPVGGI